MAVNYPCILDEPVHASTVVSCVMSVLVGGCFEVCDTSEIPCSTLHRPCVSFSWLTHHHSSWPSGQRKPHSNHHILVVVGLASATIYSSMMRSLHMAVFAVLASLGRRRILVSSFSGSFQTRSRSTSASRTLLTAAQGN